VFSKTVFAHQIRPLGCNGLLDQLQHELKQALDVDEQRKLFGKQLSAERSYSRAGAATQNNGGIGVRGKLNDGPENFSLPLC
jgi:hypothetical protein